MKTALTSQQVELYQREGWLILEDFLTSDELQEKATKRSSKR